VSCRLIRSYDVEGRNALAVVAGLLLGASNRLGRDEYPHVEPSEEGRQLVVELLDCVLSTLVDDESVIDRDVLVDQPAAWNRTERTITAKTPSEG
jgi:hypothetical protein